MTVEPAPQPSGFHRPDDAQPDSTWLEGPEFPTGTPLGPILTAWDDGRMLITIGEPGELTIPQAMQVIEALQAAVNACRRARTTLRNV